MEGDKRFRELIDRSFVEEVSEGERQLIHDHIRDCDGCKRYLELTARTIRRLRRIEAWHDTAIGGAFDSVLGRACSCGCLVGNRKTECSTQLCNGHRRAGDPDLGSLFCFQPGPFLTCFQRISQYHARSALVWLDVWRLHRGFSPCPRIYLWGRKKASNACLGLGDCRFPHTQFDWIHPLFCVPRASPWALQFLWQAYSRGRSILLTLWMLTGFQYRTHHS